MRIYSHVMPGLQRQAATDLDQWVYRESGTKLAPAGAPAAVRQVQEVVGAARFELTDPAVTAGPHMPA